MSSTSGEQPATLGDILQWLGRRWWVITLAVVLGGATGWVAADVGQKTYISTTSLQVFPVDASGEARLNLDTEAQVVKSVATANRAHDLMGATASADDLRRRVSVTVPPNTTFLEIAFQDSTPERAQAGSDAFARAYLEQRDEMAHRDVDERIANLTEQIDNLTQEDANDDIIVPLQNQRLLLQAQPIRGGQILSPASLPTLPAYPNPVLFTASGMVAGLLLGLSTALLVHRMDTRIFRAADLPEVVADQVLLELRGSRPQAEVVGPGTPMGRQFSRLRNVMQASTDTETGESSGPAGVLLVCGVTDGSASGFATANLAAAFARGGDRVIVVGGDPSSALFRALGVSPTPTYGLQHVLSGAVGPKIALEQSTVQDKVSVLAAGDRDMGEELPVAEMLRLLPRLSSLADRVIIETAPMSRAIDAQALSGGVSVLLLVVESARARAGDVATAVWDFQQVRAPLAGLLVVPAAGRLREWRRKAVKLRKRRRKAVSPPTNTSWLDGPTRPITLPARLGPLPPPSTAPGPTTSVDRGSDSDGESTRVFPKVRQDLDSDPERLPETSPGGPAPAPVDKS